MRHGTRAITKHRSKRRRGGTLSFLGNVGFGAGMMYLLDPDAGARRRGMLRDKVVHASCVMNHLMEKGMRDLQHRLQGLWAKAAGRFDRSPVDDRVLVARVRSEMGRKVSHPHAIEVTAQDGTVTMTGPILEHEVGELMRSVRKVRGVRDVRDFLEPHYGPMNLPELQGGNGRALERPAVESWAPSNRMIGAVAGFTLASWGRRRGGIFGSALAATGAMLFLRSVANMSAKKMVGRRSAVISLQKSISVQAPIDEVFAFWRHFENFPRFMEHVKDVSLIDERRTHWKVAGPAGMLVEWDAEVTNLEENRLIAWETVEGAAVEHWGSVRFQETDDGRTRLDIRMSYRPPAGVIGHAIASLFRKDPKHAMDDDLVRMKSLLENGKARAHGEHVRLEQLPTT